MPPFTPINSPLYSFDNTYFKFNRYKWTEAKVEAVIQFQKEVNGILGAFSQITGKALNTWFKEIKEAVLKKSRADPDVPDFTDGEAGQVAILHMFETFDMNEDKIITKVEFSVSMRGCYMFHLWLALIAFVNITFHVVTHLHPTPATTPTPYTCTTCICRRFSIRRVNNMRKTPQCSRSRALHSTIW